MHQQKFFIAGLIALTLSVVTQATEPTSVVTVDAKKAIGPKDPFWSCAVFHPTEFLDSDWGKEQLQLLNDSGVIDKYVRIYNQPEDAAYIKDDGTVGYRWDHFDRRADMILGHGKKLLVAFFSMPEPIIDNPKLYRRRSFLNSKKIFIGPPKDYRQWQAACADFTRHVIERYGEDQVSQWRFTCWNEPDLISFWKSSLDEYYKIYDYFAEGVKSVSTRIPIGGPSLSCCNTLNKPEIFRDFLKHITSGKNHATGKTGSPIDYLAVHTYGGAGGGGSSFCPFPSVDFIKEQQKRLVKTRDEFPKLREIPLVIQEWGVSASGTRGIRYQPLSRTRNTNYAAAFLATMVADQIDWRRNDNPRLSDMFICLSGSEIQRHHDFEGKRTVQTVNGFDKPLLNGYRALAKLGDQLVESNIDSKLDKERQSDISVIASRDKDEKRIVVLLTYFRNDRPDGKAPELPVNLELKTPWDNDVKFKTLHWRIDNSHSNSHTIFEQLGRPKKPTAEQIQLIKKSMGLEQAEPLKITQKQNQIQMSLTLPCNSVSVIELVKE